MWGQFAWTVAVAAVFLHLPGFLLLQAVRFRWTAALAAAPFVSIVVFGLLTTVYAFLGVDSSFWSLILPPLLLAGAALCVRKRFFRSGHAARFGSSWEVPRTRAGNPIRAFDAACIALYLAVGLWIAASVFADGLDGPDSFIQEYDNIHHLGVTWAYLQSGNWSSFENTLYPTAADQAVNPLAGNGHAGTGYYPSAWNYVAAAAAQVTGASAPLAGNAMNFLVMGVVFPLCSFSLMRVAFAKRPSIVPFGALCAPAFSAFPWMLAVLGPLYPNILAFALLPAQMACFAAAARGEAPREERLAFGILFAVGLPSCLFTQPNAAFALGVLLLPLCVLCAARRAGRRAASPAVRIAVQVGAGLSFVVLAAALWMAAYNLPFLQSVVSYSWPALTSGDRALHDILSLSLRSGVPQYALAACLAAGAVYLLVRRRGVWLVLAFALACAIYAVDVSCDGFWKQVLTGFWYTDSLRVAGFAIVAAVPLASAGLWLVCRTAARLAAKVRPRTAFEPLAAVCSLCLGAAFVFAVYTPDLLDKGVDSREHAFVHIEEVFDAMNDSTHDNLYDADERAFVAEVKRVVSSEDLIINMPDDGSVFSYSADGLNVYYRYLGSYGGADETDESRLIRESLRDIARRDEVRAAVDRVGARYLLLLDQGEPARPRRYLFTYEDGKDWPGIEAVDDETPGFEVVLARDDMRLYRITAAE